MTSLGEQALSALALIPEAKHHQQLLEARQEAEAQGAFQLVHDFFTGGDNGVNAMNWLDHAQALEESVKQNPDATPGELQYAHFTTSIAWAIIARFERLGVVFVGTVGEEVAFDTGQHATEYSNFQPGDQGEIIQRGVMFQDKWICHPQVKPAVTEG